MPSDPNNPPVLATAVVVSAGQTFLTRQFYAPAAYSLEITIVASGLTAVQTLRGAAKARAGADNTQVVTTAGIAATGDTRVLPVDTDSTLASGVTATTEFSVTRFISPQWCQYSLAVSAGSAVVTVILTEPSP